MKRFIINGPRQSFIVLIDDCDTSLLRTTVWKPQFNDISGFTYFVNAKRRLHRVIMHAAKDEAVLFRTDNHLDLRRSNLMKVSIQEARAYNIGLAVACKQAYLALGV